MRGVTIRIGVKDFLSSRVTTREEGRVLHDFLVSKWDDAEHFELDFSGLRVASVSFMDEVFGSLARSHSRREMAGKIKPTNIDEFDDVLYQSIIESRHKEKKRVPTRVGAKRDN